MARLRVLFHGLFAFLPDGSGITVAVPDLGVEHVYLAGSWNEEAPLLRGRKHELHLEGARKIPELSEQGHVIVHSGSEARPNLGKCYCTLRLPFPTRIVGLRYTPPSTFIFNGRQKPTGLELGIPLIEAFVYEDIEMAIRLTPELGWHPGTNLHLFCDPPSETPDGRNVNGFRRLRQSILPELELEVQLLDAARDHPRYENSTLEGVASEEECRLEERRGLSRNSSPAASFPIFVMKSEL